MGCDIHFVVEKKIGKKWVGIAASDHGYRPRGKDRNYEFFGQLAGVRYDTGIKPLGEPEDASELTKDCIHRWGPDGHSHSYCSIMEFVQTWIKANNFVDALTEEEYILLDKCLEMGHLTYEKAFKLKNGRVVFWFDN